MRSRGFWWGLWLGWLPFLLLFQLAGSEAASLNVSPVRITLPASGATQTVRVRNKGTDPVLMQVSAVEWTKDGVTDRASHDVIAVPPVFQIPGGGEQVIRVGLRRPAVDDEREQAYRLYITEVPLGVETRGSALAFAVQLNLPIFVSPRAASPDSTWKVRGNEKNQAELKVENRGNVHLRITDVRVADSLLPEAADTILPGEVVIWPLDVPLSELPDVVEIRAETNHGPIVAQVRPGAGG